MPHQNSQTNPHPILQSTEYVDYASLGLKVGIEVHQQLSTDTKLFCPCPPNAVTAPSTSKTDSPELYPIQFIRKLRPVTSELGEVDVAARFEFRHGTSVHYFANPESSCLVEADEEPPHPISQDALDTSILFGLALNAKIIDEIHVMRKIVVDGSNTSGFQRTALVAAGGKLSYDSEKFSVGVQSICVEEDAARTLNFERVDMKSYALDRLGTPLVEVALAPIVVQTPECVAKAASALGHMMRSTGRVARGLGTIRQDLNVSIMNGKVVEVKGVQQLDMISKVVRYESLRQKLLLDIARETRSRSGDVLEIKVFDVTKIFEKTESKLLRSLLSDKNSTNIVTCAWVKNFGGLIGKENSLHARLGKELGAISKIFGLGGVFHSDELPNYGITQSEVDEVRSYVRAGPDDAFVLVAGSEEKVKPCTDALVQRLAYVPKGVPDETRAATEDGETRYLRPRPGSARMYPETDIPLVVVDAPRLGRLRKIIPDRWEVQVENFQKKYGLPYQLAEQMFDSDQKRVFERVMEESENLSAPLIASVLLDTLQMLERDGVEINQINPATMLDVFKLLDEGTFAKEAIPILLKYLSSNPGTSPREAIDKLGVSSISLEELQNIIAKIISENMQLVEAKGKASQAALMGKVMQLVRGKADGKIVSQTLERNLDKILKDMGRI